MERVTVLLADDHEDFLAVVVRQLEPHFEVVKTVRNGQAMLDEAARLAPDVVVLDITMPVVNGIEAAKKLPRSRRTCCPVSEKRWSAALSFPPPLPGNRGCDGALTPSGEK